MIVFYLTKNYIYVHTQIHTTNSFTYLMNLKYRLMNSNEERKNRFGSSNSKVREKVGPNI